MVSNVKNIFAACIIFTSSLIFTDLPKTSELIHRIQPLGIAHEPFERGSLTVITGSMCSGKSEELIRLAGRFILAGFDVLVFKPAIDNRAILQLNIDPSTYISSRSGSWVECIPATTCAEMRAYIDQSSASVIAIDEVMFFTAEAKELISLISELVAAQKKVMIAGLDLNFRGEPFGPMPDLLALADNVIKLTAICTVCGTDTYCITQRLVEGKPAHYNDPLIVVGANQYEPRCRKCHIIRKD